MYTQLPAEDLARRRQLKAGTHHDPWGVMPAFFTRVWDPPSATRGATCAPLLAASVSYALYILLLVLENTACLLRVSGMSFVKTEDRSCMRSRSVKTHVVI